MLFEIPVEPRSIQIPDGLGRLFNRTVACAQQLCRPLYFKEAHKLTEGLPRLGVNIAAQISLAQRKMRRCLRQLWKCWR